MLTDKQTNNLTDGQTVFTNMLAVVTYKCNPVNKATHDL